MLVDNPCTGVEALNFVTNSRSSSDSWAWLSLRRSSADSSVSMRSASEGERCTMPVTGSTCTSGSKLTMREPRRSDTDTPVVRPTTGEKLRGLEAVVAKGEWPLFLIVPEHGGSELGACTMYQLGEREGRMAIQLTVAWCGRGAVAALCAEA